MAASSRSRVAAIDAFRFSQKGATTSLFSRSTPARSPARTGEVRYSCQATELLRAAPTCLPFRDLGQYVQDVSSGNVGVLAVLRAFGSRPVQPHAECEQEGATTAAVVP